MADFSDRNWDKIGKQEFLKDCREANDAKLKSTVYDACLQVINGHLKAESLLTALVESISVNEDIPNILADVLLLCGKLRIDAPVCESKQFVTRIRINRLRPTRILLSDIETQVAENKEQRDQYIWLLSAISNKVVSEVLLKERLDYDTTGEAKIVTNKKSAQTKFIKLKTRLYYKQQKFNLFREESEGYAKLITELCQDGDFDCDYMLQVIRSLIGCFNLDPNRVLDVILECFEYRPHLHTFYIPLIERFLNNSLTLSQILAFKFGFYQSKEEREKDSDSLVTPESLLNITALLLQSGLIKLDELYNYLSPADSTIFEQYKEELTEAKSFAKKPLTTFSPEDKANEDEKLAEFEKLHSSESNQKLGLCLSCLRVGDWKTAKEIMKKMPDFYAVAEAKIAKQICNLIHFTLDKFYRDKSGLPSAIISKIKPVELRTMSNESGLKQAENTSGLRDIVFPMISALGPYLHQDTLLIAKIIRVGKSLMTGTNSEQLKYDLLTVLDDAILPSMSLIGSNCGLSEELWQFVKNFSYGNRYRLYSNWKAEHQIPLMIRMRATTMKRIKYIMKRLSKENVKLSGRQIGKLSHSNPSFLFEYVLSQIQSYDNLIGPVVDSLKYLTSISYDVLAFCVIEALSDPNKDRTKHDGATISAWLMSLSNFCGSVVKKYPVELPGLLQFVANQLKAEKSLDLLILKEIVQKMAGIEATDEMTNEQLSAMSGGEHLRAEGGYFNQVRNTRKSSVRLKDALLESNLAMPLCILMAQQRNCVLYCEQEHSHLKLVGKLYDQCQETLVQYGSFLSSSLSIDDYIGRLPQLHKLVTEYNLTADVAFFLVRPMIVHHINIKFEELKKGERPSKYNLEKMYIESWEYVTKPIVDSIVPAFTPKFWDDLSPRFFVTFWTLSMFDLEVPRSSYDREVDRLKNQITQTEENKDLVQNKKKKEVERCRSLQERLLQEQLNQDDHVKRVKLRLEKEKDQWFQSSMKIKSLDFIKMIVYLELAKMEMTTQFLQHCLFPRCIFTAADALYCAKFVHLLHTIKTPNFSTLICYDRIFGDISYTMCSCTVNEANHYGRFLCGLLETVMRWHKDKNVFEKECSKYPGFVTKFCDKDPGHVDYENYRHVCHKWHYRLTKAFIVCLDSNDYVQIRNSLIVLTKVLPYFPVIISFAQAIERRVESIRVSEKEKRPDLYALATGYSGHLKLKKSSFVPESEFHLKEGKKGANQTNVTKAEKKETIKSSESLVNNSISKSPPAKEKRESSKTKNESTNDVSVNDKKKESKSNDSTRTTKREEKINKGSDRVGNAIVNNKSDSKSSTAMSPRKSEYRGRSVEPTVESDREHKRRKVDKNRDESDREKERGDNSERRRGGDDSTSSSPSGRGSEKKTNSRKRDLSEDTPTDSKRRKDEDVTKLKKANNDERDSSRKPSSDVKRNTSSSRRTKVEDK
ncbi:THO complex subunit 2-like isoform X1 [Leptotrombidium deliense]|uniref:THO complex subunit 2 n=1 Tax=Leptotrombidium deliense TaxID=299467 RepID=A0A443SGN6_9ACAR|nr:THO complex subunit 2-like isoform X1 [Leptotrombidium deliense]